MASHDARLRVLEARLSFLEGTPIPNLSVIFKIIDAFQAADNHFNKKGSLHQSA